MDTEDMLRAEVYGLLAATYDDPRSADRRPVDADEVERVIREARESAAYDLREAERELSHCARRDSCRAAAAVYRWLAREIREVGRR